MSPLPSHSSSEQLSDLLCDIDDLLREVKTISPIVLDTQLSAHVQNDRDEATAHIDAGNIPNAEEEGDEEVNLTQTQTSLRWRKWREELVESTLVSVVDGTHDDGELHTVMLRQSIPPPLPPLPPISPPLKLSAMNEKKTPTHAEPQREPPSSSIRSRFSWQERGDFLRTSRCGSDSVPSATLPLCPAPESGLVGGSDHSLRPELERSGDHALTIDSPGSGKPSRNRPRLEAWDHTSDNIGYDQELHLDPRETQTQDTPATQARAYLADFYAQEIRNSIRHHEIHEPAPRIRHVSAVGEEQLQYPASFFCVGDTTPERQVHFERAYGRLMGDIPDTPWNIPRFRDFYSEHVRLREIRANEIEPVMEIREELWTAEPELEEDEKKGLMLPVRSDTTFGGSFVKRLGSIRSNMSSDRQVRRSGM